IGTMIAAASTKKTKTGRRPKRSASTPKRREPRKAPTWRGTVPGVDRQDERPAPPFSIGAERYVGSQVKSPQYAKRRVAARIVAVAVRRRSGGRKSAPARAFDVSSRGRRQNAGSPHAPRRPT